MDFTLLLANAAPEGAKVVADAAADLPPAYGWEGISNGDGISIALVGMAIVFSGLTFISFAIAMLPKILNRDDKPGETTATAAAHKDPVILPPDSDELMCAFAYVIHRELEERNSDNQKITIPIGPASTTSWSLAGKMRSLPRSV